MAGDLVPRVRVKFLTSPGRVGLEVALDERGWEAIPAPTKKRCGGSMKESLGASGSSVTKVKTVSGDKDERERSTDWEAKEGEGVAE